MGAAVASLLKRKACGASCEHVIRIVKDTEGRRRSVPRPTPRRVAGRPEPREVRETTALARQLEPRMRASFLKTVRDLYGSEALKKIQAALRASQPLPPDALTELVTAMARGQRAGFVMQMQAANVAGGDYEATQLPPVVARRAGAPVVYDPVTAGAVDWSQRRAAALVTEITADTRAALNDTVATYIKQGVRPEVMAREIKGMIGLRSDQQQAALNYRAALEAQGIKAERIDRMVERYQAEQLKQRAELIARTETMTAINEGRASMMQEVVDTGLLLETEVTKTWATAKDERVCPVCGPMDGVSVQRNETFVLPDATEIEQPPAHPNCRCVVTYDYNLDDAAFAATV